ncbi:MAG: YfiR family protein [Bacteroidetes bacterium]|nr:YfiR family protein [Bacteroidota bacterium]
MKLIIFIALALNFISGKRPAESKDTTAKIKAVFLYNFTKYIEWPEDKRDGNFVIGILGQTEVYNELAESARLNNEKKVSVRVLQIKKYLDARTIADCHMLYIPTDRSGLLNAALKKVTGHHTLVVTDKAGLAKTGGAAINFVVQNNKVKFEMNKANVLKHELKVSMMLTNLAILVN